MIHYAINKTARDSTEPLLIHVPHSSTSIPSNYRSQIILSDAELDRELLAMTDHYTDELFTEHALAAGGTAFVNQLSRLVFDPERFEDDSVEPMSEKGMGAVYTSTADLRSLRAPDFPSSAREEILRDLFRPYAAALEGEVTEQLRRFGRCLIIDAHSFPSIPLPYEDASLDRPDLCIGFDEFHAPDVLIDALERVGRDAGWTVGRNTPFAGSYMPLAYYGKDPRVSSVMLEINRNRYMDEATGERSEEFKETRDLVGRLVETATLFEAFRNTNFHAELPSGNVCIRIGAATSQLDALPQHESQHSWLYITAHNPNGKTAPAVENERAQAELARELRSRGLSFYNGQGQGDVGDWPPEPSFLVIGASEPEALELGRRFGQAAVVVGERQQAARLLLCEPD